MTHDNISASFRPITELADLTPHAEFLPYPNNDFDVSIDEDLQRMETKKPVSDFNHRHDQINNTNEVNPCFPTRTDRMAMMNGASIRKCCEMFKEYLNRIVEHRKFRHHLRQFFNVSFLSFIHGICISQKENYLLKRVHNDSRGSRRLIHLPSALNSSLIHHREYVHFEFDAFRIEMHIVVDDTGVKNGIEIKPSGDETFRLDILLGKITVCFRFPSTNLIVLFEYDVPFTMVLNSSYTKRTVLFWFHHKEMVVIHQKVAFLYGIDLCFG
ncbi:unnamed protein product [Adineta ricciae]|uniref:Uncharacterized protein n=1 Tax=Adineta ricciae TaxID=249248 RepID=A0A815JJT0_ADIRI|nr:unnamed protein product [Adineta ricciae]CAF1436535.1 unnamed protein product [Adineta ricciae]